MKRRFRCPEQVIDVRSYFINTNTPLSVSSQYIEKSILGGKKILTDHHIVNAKVFK